MSGANAWDGVGSSDLDENSWWQDSQIVKCLEGISDVDGSAEDSAQSCTPNIKNKGPIDAQGGDEDEDSDEDGSSWQARFQELAAFRNRSGHCNIRQGSKEASAALTLWMKRQRYHYKRKQEGKSYRLTSEREQALTRLGFVWDVRGLAWHAKIEELKAFIAEHGHANVPVKYTRNRALGVWMKRQRRQYALYQALDPKTSMTPARIRELASLGVEWST